MNELKNIDVHILSIVDKGANKRKVIWKADHTAESTIQRTIPILKTDDDKRIVYGIVYSPNDEDTHGDFAIESEIEKACYGFMKKSKTNSIDTQHDMEINKDCYVGENWIVKSNDELFPDDKGAWAVGIKVENDEIWKGIKDGTYTGISMYGFAEKIEKESDLQTESQIEKGIMNFIKKVLNPEADHSEIKKDFNDRIVMMDFPKLLDALYNAAYDILYDDNITDKNTAILNSVDQFKTYLQSIEEASAVAKAGKYDEGDFKQKLEAAMDQIQAIVEGAEKSIEKRKTFLNKRSSEKKEEGDSEMTNEEIEKKIEEAVKPLQEANDQLKKSNEEAVKKSEDLQKELDELKKKSKGSSQEDPEEKKDDSKPEVKKYSWLGGIKS